jgi:hypothetical protein
MRGEPWNPNWGESWKTIRTDPSEWDRLRTDLRQEFETLRDAIQRQSELPGEYLNGVLALIRTPPTTWVPYGRYWNGCEKNREQWIRHDDSHIPNPQSLIPNPDTNSRSMERCG